jgi:TetR/AcrR family transcriptional regulator
MGRYDSSQKRTILEAAIAVFAEKGLEGATIRLVGRKAGVNSALIYYYFENKEKLFEESIRLVFGDFLATLGRHKKPFEDARARIDFLVNGIFDYYETRRKRMQLMMQVFNLHVHLLARIIFDVLRQEQVFPLIILQDGIQRKELKPFSPIQLWWNLLGMCIFTIQAEEIASRLEQKKLPWDLPPLAERKKQIVALLLSGLAVPPEKIEG